MTVYRVQWLTADRVHATRDNTHTEDFDSAHQAASFAGERRREGALVVTYEMEVHA